MKWIPDHRPKRANKDCVPTRLQRFSRWLHNRSLASKITKRQLTVVANCTCIVLFDLIRQSVGSQQLIGFQHTDIDDAIYLFVTALILLNYVSILFACLYNLTFNTSASLLPSTPPTAWFGQLLDKSKLYHFCCLVIVSTTLVVEKAMYDIHTSESIAVVSISYRRALECYRLLAFAVVCLLWLGLVLVRSPNKQKLIT